MAGLKAAPYAPTWPDINGRFWPHGGEPATGILSLFENPITVQIIHRCLGYIVLVLIAAWYMRSLRIRDSALLARTRSLPLVITVVQIVLGIFTVLNATSHETLLWLGVTHQFVALLLLLVLVFEFYLLGRSEPARSMRN